ncbi:MAG: alpha/beta hydrolase [Bacteroidetes bacterium]|nr:MAG: alpha/beta hydrolase [Bacteroidota bacterium]
MNRLFTNLKQEKMNISIRIIVFLGSLWLLTGCDTGQNSSTPNFAEVPKSGYVEVGNARLEYKIEGTGIPVIVPGSTVYDPRTFSENLRKDCQLIFYNMRWFTPDYVPKDLKNEITLDTILSDIDRLRQQLGLEKVAIMGHSLHGVIALEYARRYPEHVTHVIAVAAPAQKGEAAGKLENEYWSGYASQMRKMKFQYNWDLHKDSIAAMDIADGAIATYINNAPIYFYNPDYDSKWLWEGVRLNVPVMSHVFTDVFFDFKLTNGPTIEVPAFVAVGYFDFSAPPVLWDDQKSAFSNLTYVVFNKSGHSPQLEEAELFDQKLLDWLKGTK